MGARYALLRQRVRREYSQGYSLSPFLSETMERNAAMKAIVCHELTGAASLQLEKVPEPRPGPGRVRLKIRACGVNFADSLITRGQYQKQPQPPFSPGFEVSGEVLELGMGVEGIKVGDRIIAITPYGGYAEEAGGGEHQSLCTDADSDVLGTGCRFPSSVWHLACCPVASGAAGTVKTSWCMVQIRRQRFNGGGYRQTVGCDLLPPADLKNSLLPVNTAQII